MSYFGDINLEDTIDIKFTTRRFTTGAPFTLAGTPVISAYVGNSTTEITAGITLTADFDARTGLNNVRVAATAANGFTAATNVQLVITTGTVDSVSVVGEVVGSFSIAARSALRPTVASRTLDVTATGAAGIDWANLENPTTAVDLSGTNIKTNQKVDVETIKTQAVTAAAGVTFPTSIASPTNITAGTITTATNLTNAPTAGDFTAVMKTSIGTAVAASAVASVTAGVTVTTNNDKTGYTLSATGSAAMTEGYAADGAAPTLGQFQYMIWGLLAERSRSGTTLTAMKLDGVTPAMTFTLDSAVAPSSQTRAT